MFNLSLDISERNDSVVIKTHEQRLHEINTLDWDELVVPIDPNNHNSPQEGMILTCLFSLEIVQANFGAFSVIYLFIFLAGNSAGFELPNQHHMNNYKISVSRSMVFVKFCRTDHLFSVFFMKSY